MSTQLITKNHIKPNIIIEELPPLNNRHKLEIPADVSYCYFSEIEMFKGTSGDLGYFLEHTGLNVTKIFDDMENGNIDNLMSSSIYENVDFEFDKWYRNEANDMEKSVVFYKFLFGLENQLNEFSSSLFDYLEELNINIDKRLSFSNIMKKIKTTTSQVITTNSDWFDDNNKQELAVSRINNLFDFLNIINQKYNLYKSNLKYTLDEVMMVLVHQQAAEAEIYLSDLTERLDNYLGDRETDLNGNFNVNKPKKKIKNSILKKEKKSIRRMLNKSIDTISSFLPKKDLHCFINGETFDIKGTHFNYRIGKKENYNLLQKERDLNSAHIPYELDLYNKDGDYLANLCITFNGCPILDQILSVYLMISANQEEDMLDKCNFYKKSEDFLEDKTVKKLLSERFEKKDSNINTLRRTLQSFEHSKSELKKIDKRKKEKYLFKKYVKNKIFTSIFEKNTIEFIFNSEVSFDEMTDYYSISRNGDRELEFGNGGMFSDNRLDNLVVI